MTISCYVYCVRSGQADSKEIHGRGPGHLAAPGLVELPKGAKEIALICDDPDAPTEPWVHWVIYKIPARRPACRKVCRGRRH